MTQTQTDGAIPALTRGWRMRMALAHAGVSVGDMADYLEVDRNTIGRWTGDKGPVKRSILLLWAMRTNVSLAWLENGETPGTGEGDGGLGVYASRDLNPEPADYEDHALTWDDAA